MRKKKLKRYKVSSNDSICFAVSVVSQPAVESNFMTFSEAKVQNFVAVEEQDRHMLYGCALRANYPIYRRDDNGYEYILEFDRNAIDEIVKKYFKMGFQNSWTEAHDEEVNGLTICESWIKESDTFDKSIQLGLDPNIECGSWLIGVYCENEDIWQKCKNGEYQGFSVEAMVSLEEFDKIIEDGEKSVEDDNNMIDFSEMSSKEFFDKIKEIILDAWNSKSDKKEEEAPKVEEVEMEQQPTETIVETPTETVVETPEEPIAPEVVEQPKVEEIASPEANDEPTEPKKDAHLEELIKNLTAEIAALKEANNGLTEKVKEMSHEPSVKPVNPQAKPSAGDAYSQWRETMRNLVR